MARFKILKSSNCRDGSASRESEFVVDVLSGALVVDDKFRLYETHHYSDYTVRSVRRESDKIVIRCQPSVWYDGWHEGSVLDTDDLKSGLKYGFGGAGQLLYHPDALKAAGVVDNPPRGEG